VNSVKTIFFSYDKINVDGATARTRQQLEINLCSRMRVNILSY